MSLTFPCPNPTCTEVFSSQDVRGAVSLTCPRCGHVFQFGTPAPRPAPPPPPAARRPTAAPKPPPAAKASPPSPPVPVATPVSAKVPVAEPIADESQSGIFVPPPEPPKSNRGSKPSVARTRGKRSSKPWLLPVILSGALLVLAVGAWFARDWWLHRAPVEDDVPPLKVKELNFSFRLPRSGWKDDDAAERGLGAQIAMRRSDPNSWFGIVVRNFKDRMPRDDEMVREAVERLERLFKVKPAWEQKDDSTFAGLPAHLLIFVAEYNSVPVSGECLMVADKGIGYWFFGWTPSTAERPVLRGVQDEWETIRQGFTLLKERDGWTGKVPEVVEVEGSKAGYRLKYTKDIWEKKDADDGDLLLLGRDPDSPQDGRKWVRLRVFVRPPSDDPQAGLKEARAFLEAREKDLYPKVKMDAVPEEAKGGLADGAVQLGQAKGWAVRLHVDRGEDYEHFFVVAAVPQPAYTLVIVGECPWQLRQTWADRFGPIMHSVRFEKK